VKENNWDMMIQALRMDSSQAHLYMSVLYPQLKTIEWWH